MVNNEAAWDFISVYRKHDADILYASRLLASSLQSAQVLQAYWVAELVSKSFDYFLVDAVLEFLLPDFPEMELVLATKMRYHLQGVQAKVWVEGMRWPPPDHLNGAHGGVWLALDAEWNRYHRDFDDRVEGERVTEEVVDAFMARAQRSEGCMAARVRRRQERIAEKGILVFADSLYA